jgi:hypothetical protein
MKNGKIFLQYVTSGQNIKPGKVDPRGVNWKVDPRGVNLAPVLCVYSTPFISPKNWIDLAHDLLSWGF